MDEKMVILPPGFASDLSQQVAENLKKWGGQHDRHHSMKDWALILGEQVGKLQMSVLNEDEDLYARLMKVGAVLVHMDMALMRQATERSRRARYGDEF